MIAGQSGYLGALEAEGTDEAQNRILNINELINAAREAESAKQTIEEFLDHAALISDTDQLDSQSRITLLTMHNAKGLEFPVVFIVGCEEGLFPHIRSNENTDDLEEERRLCYVAMTRAQTRLWIIRSRMRRTYGSDVPTMIQASRFIGEIPKALVNNLSGPDSDSEYHRARSPARGMYRQSKFQPASFPRAKTYAGATHNTPDAVRKFLQSRPAPPPVKPEPAAPGRPVSIRPGSRVFHSQYGMGVVVDREKVGDDFKLTVSFVGIGPKKLMEKFAKLKKV